MLRTPYFSTTIYLEMGIKSFCNVSVIEPFFFNRLKLFWELCFLLTRYIPFSLFRALFYCAKEIWQPRRQTIIYIIVVWEAFLRIGIDGIVPFCLMRFLVQNCMWRQFYHCRFVATNLGSTISSRYSNVA